MNRTNKHISKHNKQPNTAKHNQTNSQTQQNKKAYLILATSFTGVGAVSSLTTAEVARLALALVPANIQGETDVGHAKHDQRQNIHKGFFTFSK